jgi:hypothetical protein
MPALVAGIHVFLRSKETWMAVTSTAMTRRGCYFRLTKADLS